MTVVLGCRDYPIFDLDPYYIVLSDVVIYLYVMH